MPVEIRGRRSLNRPIYRTPFSWMLAGTWAGMIDFSVWVLTEALLIPALGTNCREYVLDVFFNDLAQSGSRTKFRSDCAPPTSVRSDALNSVIARGKETCPTKIIRFRHSSLIERAKRSAYAFKSGVRGGSRITAFPDPAIRRRNCPNWTLAPIAVIDKMQMRELENQLKLPGWWFLPADWIPFCAGWSHVLDLVSRVR